MKRRLLALTAAFVLALILIPSPAFAASYVASRNSDVFHKSSCFYVDRINEGNKVYYSTAEEAEAAGKRGCSRCNPSYGISDSTYGSAPTSTETSRTYADGYRKGKEHGYANGYGAGKVDAKAELEEEYKARIEDERKESATNAYTYSVIFGAPAVAFLSAYFVSRIRDKTEKEQSERIIELQRELTRERNASALRAASSKIACSEIPPDVTLKLSCTPIKGIITPEKPFGEYTVYTTSSGKKYHCKYRCCNATNPVHLFMIPKDLTACSNCVPTQMRFSQPPSWYLQITNPKKETADSPVLSKAEENSAFVKSGSALGEVDSTAFSFIDYQNTVLILVFRSGGEYHYYNVPKHVYKELLAAPSKGKYYHEKIKDQYPYY